MENLHACTYLFSIWPSKLSFWIVVQNTKVWNCPSCFHFVFDYYGKFDFDKSKTHQHRVKNIFRLLLLMMSKSVLIDNISEIPWSKLKNLPSIAQISHIAISSALRSLCRWVTSLSKCSGEIFLHHSSPHTDCGEIRFSSLTFTCRTIAVSYIWSYQFVRNRPSHVDNFVAEIQPIWFTIESSKFHNEQYSYNIYIQSINKLNHRWLWLTSQWCVYECSMLWLSLNQNTRNKFIAWVSMRFRLQSWKFNSEIGIDIANLNINGAIANLNILQYF